MHIHHLAVDEGKAGGFPAPIKISREDQMKQG